MDFRQIESLVAIVKHGSFTKAAEELYLSQPTLTGHIQAIENELGTILFNRNGKTVTLTEAGKIMYNYAINMLNMREQALYSMTRYKGRFEGELVIASSTIPQGYLLPSMLASFSRKYPDIRYIIKQFDSKGVIDTIISGSIDFGFVGTSNLFSGLEMLKLCEDCLVLITPNKGKYKKHEEDSVFWNQIKNERFILREGGSATRGLLLKALEQKGIDVKNLNVVASIENPNTIKQCVKEGLGVAVVSKMSVSVEEQVGSLKSFYISDLDLRRGFYFISHKNRVLNPVSRAFREFVKEYFNTPSP